MITPQQCWFICNDKLFRATKWLLSVLLNRVLFCPCNRTGGQLKGNSAARSWVNGCGRVAIHPVD